MFTSLRKSLTALSAVVALFAAACGSSSATNDTDPAEAVDGDAAATSSPTATATAAGEPVELTFATYQPEDAPLVQSAVRWMEAVEDATGGQITFDKHFGGALLSATELRDGASAGATDIALFAETYHVDDFLLSEGLITMPGSSNMIATGEAILQLYDENAALQAQYADQGLTLMGYAPVAETILATTDTRIETLADMEGLELRGLDGAGVNTGLRLAGANSVSITLPELYEAADRGVVDGFFGIGVGIATAQSLHEVLKYWTEPGLGTVGLGSLVVSNESFTALPEDVQEVLVEEGRQIPRHYAEIVQEGMQSECEKLEAEEATAYGFPDSSEVQEWRDEIAEEQFSSWVTRLESQSVDINPDEYLARYEEVYAEIEGSLTDGEGLAGFAMCTGE